MEQAGQVVYQVKQPQASGSQAEVLFPPPLPSPPPGTVRDGAAHKLQLGRGSWELFLQRGRRWREPELPGPKASGVMAWGELRAAPTASVYPSGPT